MRALRRHLVGLPLQRSTFSNLGDAPAWLGVDAPHFDVAALTVEGDLHVDDRGLAELGSHVARLPADVLAAMTERVRGCTKAAANAPALAATDAPPTELMTAIGETLSTFVPLPVLGKCITTAIHQALVAVGFVGTAPAPSPSPGVRLTHDLVALANACALHGVGAEIVSRDWPDVPPVIVELLCDFALDHSGFGPLAWEAPGLEEPELVAAQLGSVASGVRDAPPPRTQPTAPDLAGTRGHALFEALEAWLDATESGLHIVRTAFHRGIRPLLAARAHDFGMTPSDVLFMRFDEFGGALPEKAEIHERRRTYIAASAYLEAHNIDANRPDELWAAA